MDMWYLIFLVTMLILSLVYYAKNIKDIKIFRISLPILIAVIFALIILAEQFILPLNSYYIKAKDEIYIERIIMNEMSKSGINYDTGSFKIINSFIGKYHQLYLCKYENDGVEEVRLFDFRQNIFGHLKPAHDFSKSKIIDKDYHSFRFVNDGFASYYVTYGHAEGESIYEDLGVGKFKIGNLNPEGYFILVERYNPRKTGYWFIKTLIFGAIIAYRIKEDRKREYYTVTKLSWKQLNVLVVEYYK